MRSRANRIQHQERCGEHNDLFQGALRRKRRNLDPAHHTRSVATDTVTYSYETVEVPVGSKNMVTRPHEALAPVPAGVSCSPTLKAGCRALTFNYATSTTAKGETPTEWGDIEGNLTRVYYTAWEPTGKIMKKVEVARYEYDKQARLRAEWDPRVEKSTACGGACSALKTKYGYDAEGHVTALTAPGQETLGIVYGTRWQRQSRSCAEGDPGAGGNDPLDGGRVDEHRSTQAHGRAYHRCANGYNRGKWSGNPIVYGYQWEDCTSGGSGCVAIPGATNANYTPTSKDEGARLAVVVTATNGSGSSSATVYEPIPTPTYTSSFGSYGTGNGQLREPEGGLAVDSSGDVWVSDTENSRLEEFNSKGEFVRTVGSSGEGAGQFGWTYSVTVDSKGNIWATDGATIASRSSTPKAPLSRCSVGVSPTGKANCKLVPARVALACGARATASSTCLKGWSWTPKATFSSRIVVIIVCRSSTNHLPGCATSHKPKNTKARST